MDFTDRGAPRPPIGLPGGAYLCFSVGVAYEGFLKACQYRHRTTPLDKPDLFSLSFAEYGLRVGVWRLLEIFDKTGIKASFSTSGLAAQRYPKTLRAVAERGHEIVGHGWSNDGSHTATEDPTIEREEIRRTLGAIADATGLSPVGWVSPGSMGSQARRKLLVEETGVIWTGDDASEDLPYVVDVEGKPHAIMPRTNFGSNDLIMWLNPHNPPSAFFDSFKDQFDQLYAEGREGSPKWMDMVIHCHMAGRATLAPAIRRCIDYALSHEGVWPATKGAFAQWIIEHPEYHG